MFESERLIYRAIEDNDEDLDFLHSISLDAEGFANSNTLALVPPNKEATRRWKQHLETCILAVFICLPPSDPDPDPDPTRDAKNEVPAQPGKKAGPTPTPVGLISLFGSPNMRTAQHRNANIGIDILPDYQRRGYGGEAINWVVEWGFQTYGLHRIGIESFSHSEGAGRLYETLGFVPEQRKREALWFRGGWSDLLGFAMLEDEWRARQGMKEGQTGGN
jgi:RimJ/RimL family protein N-acetyltransferase